jgi:hypothetical protein
MAPKGCFRRGRKSMNSMPEGFAFEVVRPVYLLNRRDDVKPATASTSGLSVLFM